MSDEKRIPECIHCSNLFGCKIIKQHKEPCLNFEERKAGGDKNGIQKEIPER